MNGRVLIWRNLGETLARFLSLFMAVMFGAVLLLAVSGAIGREVARSASALDNRSALTVLEIYSFNGAGTPLTPLTARSIAAMRRIDGIEDVRISGRFALLADDPELDHGVYWATPRAPWVQAPLSRIVAGLAQDHTPADDEVYFPDSHAGASHSAFLGKRVAIQYNRATAPGIFGGVEGSVRVIGLYDRSRNGTDGESAVYVSDAMFHTLLAAQLGLPAGSAIPEDFDYGKVYVKVSSTRALQRVQSALAATGFTAHSMAAREEDLPAVLTLVSRINDILGALLLIFCVGIGLSLGRDWSRQRRWDVGVLTSLGWAPGRILALYGAEILIAGIVVGLGSAILGSLASLALGSALTGHQILGATFVNGADAPPATWLIAVITGAPLALFLGAAPRVLWLANLPPDVALRSRR